MTFQRLKNNVFIFRYNVFSAVTKYKYMVIYIYIYILRFFHYDQTFNKDINKSEDTYDTSLYDNLELLTIQRIIIVIVSKRIPIEIENIY